MVWQRKQLSIRNFLCNMDWGLEIKIWEPNVFHRLSVCRPALSARQLLTVTQEASHFFFFSSFWMTLVFQLQNLFSVYCSPLIPNRLLKAGIPRKQDKTQTINIWDWGCHSRILLHFFSAIEILWANDFTLLLFLPNDTLTSCCSASTGSYPLPLLHRAQCPHSWACPSFLPKGGFLSYHLAGSLFVSHSS